MYAFGCSLGSVILGLYLAFEGERATQYLDGAVLYATPWNTRDGFEYFTKNFFGFYSWVIGIKLNMDLRSLVLPKMKHLLSEEDYEYYKQVMDQNKIGLPVLDEKVFTKMYGYRNVHHFYDYVTVADKVLNIKVPTFALSAADDQLCGDEFVPRKQA